MQFIITITILSFPKHTLAKHTMTYASNILQFKGKKKQVTLCMCWTAGVSVIAREGMRKREEGKDEVLGEERRRKTGRPGCTD